MVNLVEFPNLGISLEVNRVAFTIFGMPIYWYGVLIGVGMFLAVLFAFSQAPRYGINVDRMIDVIFIGFVLAIIGGRAYYVLFVDAQYRTFFQLIDLRSGGIAIYGAIIGAFVGALIGCKWRKVPLLPMFDLVGMGFLIGQAIGRWGNFFNQEAFGDNTLGTFGMISSATVRYLESNQQSLIAKGIVVDPYTPVHPTFLYESVWCAVGFLLIFLYSRHRKFNGELFLMYIFWYGVGRFFIEGMRTDPLMVGTFRVSQLLAAVSAVAAAGLWVYGRVKNAGKPLVIPEIAPQSMKVAIDTPDGRQKVTITWPGDMRAPSREQARAMALQVWDAEQQMKPGGEPEEKAGEKPAAEAEEKPVAPKEEAAKPKATAKKEKPASEAEAEPAKKKPAAKKAKVDADAPKEATAKPAAKKSAAKKPAAKKDEATGDAKAPAKKPAAKKPAAKKDEATGDTKAPAKKPATKKPAAKKAAPKKSESKPETTPEASDE